MLKIEFLLSLKGQDFPDGPVVESPPANAGVTGSIPGPGRSHMPQSGWAHTPQLLSLYPRAWEPQLLSPTAETRALESLCSTVGKTMQCSEKPMHRNQKVAPQFSSVQFSSVAQSCPTLCDPMNRSTPGLPVHHHLREFTQTHVHRVGDAIQPSHPRSSPSPPAPNPSQHQSLFQ